MKTITLSFRRTENRNFATYTTSVAIVEFHIKDDMRIDHVLPRFKEAVTDFVKSFPNTQPEPFPGSEGFNIGDLALHDSTFSNWARGKLRNAGIIKFNILFCGDVNDEIDFDEQLTIN